MQRRYYADTTTNVTCKNEHITIDFTIHKYNGFAIVEAEGDYGIHIPIKGIARRQARLCEYVPDMPDLPKVLSDEKVRSIDRAINLYMDLTLKEWTARIIRIKQSSARVILIPAAKGHKGRIILQKGY